MLFNLNNNMTYFHDLLVSIITKVNEGMDLEEIKSLYTFEQEKEPGEKYYEIIFNPENLEIRNGTKKIMVPYNEMEKIEPERLAGFIQTLLKLNAELTIQKTPLVM